GQDMGYGAGDLPSYEGLPPARGFVVKQDAVTRMQSVGFTVIDRDPVGVKLGAPVRAARIERSLLGLRNLSDQPVHLTGGRLIETRIQTGFSDSLEQADRPSRCNIGGVFRAVEANSDMALSGKIVDLLRLHPANQPGQSAGVAEIPVVEKQAGFGSVRIGID